MVRYKSLSLLFGGQSCKQTAAAGCFCMHALLTGKPMGVSTSANMYIQTGKPISTSANMHFQTDKPMCISTSANMYFQTGKPMCISTSADIYIQTGKAMHCNGYFYFYFSQCVFPFSKAICFSASKTTLLFCSGRNLPSLKLSIWVFVQRVSKLQNVFVQASKCICPTSKYISPALTRSGTQVPLWIRRCQNSTSPRWTLSTTALSSRILLM